MKESIQKLSQCLKWATEFGFHVNFLNNYRNINQICNNTDYVYCVLLEWVELLHNVHVRFDIKFAKTYEG